MNKIFLPYPNLTKEEEKVIEDSKKLTHNKNKSKYKLNMSKSKWGKPKMSYRKSSPMKKLLSNKQPVVRIGGY